ncbi:30S ribosomal protein S20 [Francisellaceae bacterium]|nr:30S ribosomal protein S20 [Francisellaceae bacterium]
MANSKQATKRARQAVKLNAHNSSMRTFMRTCIKNTIKMIEANDAEGAKAAYAKLVPVLDSYSSKGLLHKNKAARHKSRLNAKIKAMTATKAA